MGVQVYELRERDLFGAPIFFDARNEKNFFYSRRRESKGFQVIRKFFPPATESPFEKPDKRFLMRDRVSEAAFR